MNVVGVEYRPSYLVLAFADHGHPPRLMGDGRRLVIPAAISAGKWGSDAAASTESTWDGYAFGAKLIDLWGPIEERVKGFTGGISQHSLQCRTVFATSIPADEITAVARQVKCDVPIVISPLQAALSAWLARQSQTDETEQVVLVVTIGDRSVESGAFAVRVGARPTILQMAGEEALAENGAACWAQHVIQEVSGLVSRGSDHAPKLDLWQAAVELGDRIRRSPRGATVAWNGPLVDSMVAPLSYAAEDLFGWHEFQSLNEWLGRATRKLIATLGCVRPDVVLLSGLGASWPLPPDALEEFPVPTVPANPAGELALGAAWWPGISTGDASFLPRPIVLRGLPSTSHPATPAPVSARLEFQPATTVPVPVPSPAGTKIAEFDRLMDAELKELSPDQS